MPISDDCTDDRLKYFKNCLGALDGTLIIVMPPTEYKSRYRTRKSNLATNVLGVCAPDMQFIYVLPGWEGSAHNGRVLHDAICRPNGLKVPQYIGFIGTFCDFSKYYRELNNVVEERTNVFGADNEVKALIEALQEMTCDPLWKTNGGIQEWLHGRVA
ncbi:hypothetical protein ACH5RR_006526 [Cinchona calisaya]|uniref:DDE Tnp4 domain-containing protein n=1 Tax=Cinchona calisaya TaxID=153742 RepID=A0ABD3APA6_9GENT